MARTFSFWGRKGGSRKIRVNQMAEYLGGKVHPTSGYEDDICIFVKVRPFDPYPRWTYCDVIDETFLYNWLSAHRDVGVLSQSLTGQRYIQDILKRDVIYLPEHHCNYDRETRPNRPIRKVGVMGNVTAFQWAPEATTALFAEIGLEYEHNMVYLTRDQVVDFYKTLDIQVVFRPWSGISQISDPLKLKNAGSFGIPTVAYPEPSYVAEFDGCFLPARTIEEVVDGVTRLRDDRTLYQEIAGRAQARAERYHIEHIAQEYLQLGNGEGERRAMGTDEAEAAAVTMSMRAKMYDKTLRVNGAEIPVFGMGHFNVKPRKQGIGRHVVKAMEAMAEKAGKHCVVAFCASDVLPFYMEVCGWHKIGEFRGHHVIASKPLANVVVTEEW